MAYAIQLDLFEKEDSFSILEKRVGFMDKKLGNIQRGTFARIGVHDEKLELVMELIQKQQFEIDTLKKKLGDPGEVLNFMM